MENIYLISGWFFGWGIIFKLFFALISLSVSLYAFKIYKLSKQNQPKLFGFAFLFFSLSYFIQSFLNFAIISKLNQNICDFLKIQTVETLNILGMYTHMILFMIGIVTLIYMTLNITNKKLYSLILTISLLFILIPQNNLYAFYLLSSIFLIYIFTHYLSNFLKNKQTKTLLISTAFAFLLFGNLHFIFAINHALLYILGNFLELIAYLLILSNLILILKNGKKKK